MTPRPPSRLKGLPMRDLLAVGVVFAATPAFPWLNARVVAPILTFLFNLA